VSVRNLCLAKKVQLHGDYHGERDFGSDSLDKES
jgi:hypothetical protein